MNPSPGRAAFFIALVLAACNATTPSPAANTPTPAPVTEQPNSTPAATPPGPPSGVAAFSVDPADVEARYDAALPLFEYERTAPLDLLIGARRGLTAIEITEATFSSSTGETVPALIVAPKAHAGLPGIVWLYPGPGADLTDRAEAIARLGVMVILIDIPQIRRSREFQFTFTDTDRSEQIELMIELRRAVDVLIEVGADPHRLGFIGYSWGGAMGAALAGIEHRIGSYALMFADGGVVEHMLESPDRSFAAGLPAARRPAWFAAMEPLEPLYFIGHAAPSALLFQNGLRDEAVARMSADRLHAMASVPKEIRWYDSGHDPTPDAPEVWCEQAVWLKDHLELSSSDVAECRGT